MNKSDDFDWDDIGLQEGREFLWENIGLHENDDGTFVLLVGDTKIWYKNQKRHRLDGPACEYSDGYVEYWIDGIQLTEIEYFMKTGVVNE